MHFHNGSERSVISLLPPDHWELHNSGYTQAHDGQLCLAVAIDDESFRTVDIELHRSSFSDRTGRIRPSLCISRSNSVIFLKI